MLSTYKYSKSVHVSCTEKREKSKFHEQLKSQLDSSENEADASVIFGEGR